MLDREAITTRVAEIRRRRSFLEDFIGIDYEDFIPSEPLDRAIEYYAALNHIQIALQSCIDIAKHIIAVKNLERPKEIRDSFTILSRHKILSRELAEKFVQATSVRNILVHGYEDIDPHKIHSIIQNDLPDFEQFVVELGEYLKKEGGE